MRSPVIVIGRLAFKFARDRRGRASNLYEARLYRSVNATRRALLCPVLWVSVMQITEGLSLGAGYLEPRADDARRCARALAIRSARGTRGAP
jgi:hypothetical protein